MPNIIHNKSNFHNDNKATGNPATPNTPNMLMNPSMYPMMNSQSQTYPFSYPYYGNYPPMNPYYGMYNPYYYAQMEGMYPDSNQNAQDYRNSTSLPSAGKGNPFTLPHDPKANQRISTSTHPINSSVFHNSNHQTQQIHQPSKAT